MENDNISDKLQELLGNPDMMAKVSAMAESLFTKEEKTEESPVSSNETQMLLRAAKLLGEQKTDNRQGLLLALKPHLSADKGQRVDRAVKLLKLARLLPLIKESDLFL